MSPQNSKILTCFSLHSHVIGRSAGEGSIFAIPRDLRRWRRILIPPLKGNASYACMIYTSLQQVVHVPRAGILACNMPSSFVLVLGVIEFFIISIRFVTYAFLLKLWKEDPVQFINGLEKIWK